MATWTAHLRIITVVLNMCVAFVPQSTCPLGFWGSDCKIKCPDNCFDNHCEKQSGECFDCITGFTGLYCYETCSKNCVSTCTMNGVCMDCKVGYYGSYCENSCSENCFGKVCDKITGNCIDCAWKTMCGEHCERTCPPKCRWSECYQNCNCIMCDPNYFVTGLTCEDALSSNIVFHLISASNDGRLVEALTLSCKAGYFGTNGCQEICSTTCNSDKCDNSMGLCGACMIGYYGEVCNKLCPSQPCDETLGCDKTTGYCFGCEIGYYGVKCEETCKDCNNMACDQLTGKCNFCIKDFHGERCNHTCPKSCMACLQGYYGENCDLNCNRNCQGGCHRDTGTCNSCAAGYHGPLCNDTCPSGCNFMGCDQFSKECVVCENGFFGKEICNQTCPEYCTITAGFQTQYDSVCSRDEGNCQECVPGFWGERCNKLCSNLCKYSCDQDTGVCIGCPADQSTAPTCEKKASCSTNCNWKGCYQDSRGECYGCITGFYGRFCSARCSTRCKFDQCFTSYLGTDDGECVRTGITCKHGYWGPNCAQNCSQSCGDYGCYSETGSCLNCTENCGSSGCDLLTGVCLDCKPGYYGKLCDLICAEYCLERLCNQADGVCTFGCDPNSTSIFCVPKTEYSLRKETKLDTQTLLYIVVPTVASIGFVILILTVCAVRKFRTRQQNSSSPASPAASATPDSSSTSASSSASAVSGNGNAIRTPKVVTWSPYHEPPFIPYESPSYYRGQQVT